MPLEDSDGGKHWIYSRCWATRLLEERVAKLQGTIGADEPAPLVEQSRAKEDGRVDADQSRALLLAADGKAQLVVDLGDVTEERTRVDESDAGSNTSRSWRALRT